MIAAFALRFSKNGSAGAPSGISLSPTAVELGFHPRHRVDWSDQSDSIQLAYWHDQQDRLAGGCYADGTATAFTVGDLWWGGDGWAPGARGASRRLAKLAQPTSLDDLQSSLRGLYVAGYLTEHGDGWLLTDVLGLRLLYSAEDDEALFIATRPALAARMLAGDGGAPARDAAGACWLAFSGYRVGDATGFVGVRVAAPGARLRVTGGRPTWEPLTPLAVAPDDDLRHRSVGDLAEMVNHDVADVLRHALSRPAERHVIRLTGGKDSRLVLAVALRAGLAHEFCYETVGPPGLADVRIASSLAAHLGLRHEVKFMGLSNSVPFGTRFREFVALTGSMVNGWELATPHFSGDVTISGLCGELLRTYRKLPPDRWTDAGVADAFPRTEFGRLGLLRNGLDDVYYGQIQERLDAGQSPSVAPLDRMHSYFATSRLRFTRLGAPEELDGSHDLLPLYSPVSLRAAMAMNSGDRQSEVLTAEVIRTASELLAGHPFTDAGWSARATARTGPLEHAEVAGGATPPGRTPPPKSTSLVEVLNRGGGRGRVDLLTEILQEPSNPAWEFLDRDVALAAVDRYEALTTRERHELFGAATAAIWMADS